MSEYPVRVLNLKAKLDLSPLLDDLPLLHRRARRQLIFMLGNQTDNAPSHAERPGLNILLFASLSIKNETLMTWLPCSSYLNPIEQLWSILKRKVYDWGQQFASKEVIWNKIFRVASTMPPFQIRRLTSSVDSKLFRAINKIAVNYVC